MGSEVQGKSRVLFQAHVELLVLFIANRDEIVEKIDGLLNAQKKPIQYQQDVTLLSHQIKHCFFTLKCITQEQSGLGNQLEETHWVNGFRPRKAPGNDLIDPAEMLMRGFHFWRQTRWPGSNGRVRYANTLFNLYLIRCCALLCMRLWDAESNSVSDRLSLVQGVLDQLWLSSPTDQPVLVRDVRWLFPVTMSPTTDELAGYFEIAQQIAETFPGEDRIETFKAWVQTGGGHLRSQLHHLSRQRDVSLNESSLILITRVSNALDISLLIQGLVTLFDAYENARISGEDQKRLELAAAIYQGISPDPELFLNRLDLLGPYSMIEHLFITTDGDGQVVYTDMGRRHLQLVQRYAALVNRLAKPLYDDCLHCRPVEGSYSPYGVLYGFSSNLIELMAFKTLQRDAVTAFSMEDVFIGGETDKLSWVDGWRNLPHIKPEVIKQFEYPHQFAEDIFTRIEHELQKCATDGMANSAAQTGRLYLLSVESKGTLLPDMPLQYIQSSDPQIVAAHKAEFKDQNDLMHCRLEGEFLVSYKTPGGWVAITKDILTEVLGAGVNARIVELPNEAEEVLKLMCPNLVVHPGL